MALTTSTLNSFLTHPPQSVKNQRRRNDNKIPRTIVGSRILEWDICHSKIGNTFALNFDSVGDSRIHDDGIIPMRNIDGG
ncbi:hypothetical protein QVD17_42020 [Tagetes erecta]|uniref:Uncharacterized protein n=1 Tax=Tagetes erecta TaxID=13708 RepID=A0AAD8JLC2_TARER|nr:hypothetical protein QVD17_42020 [Tagetes erecta]